MILLFSFRRPQQFHFICTQIISFSTESYKNESFGALEKIIKTDALIMEISRRCVPMTMNEQSAAWPRPDRGLTSVPLKAKSYPLPYRRHGTNHFIKDCWRSVLQFKKNQRAAHYEDSEILFWAWFWWKDQGDRGDSGKKEHRASWTHLGTHSLSNHRGIDNMCTRYGISLNML